MKNDREKLKAALAKLEASRDLREAAKDPANGIIRREVNGRVQFIVTGVPRHPDENERVPDGTKGIQNGPANPKAKTPLDYVIPDPPPPVHPDQPPKDFYISISEWEICQASYEVRDDGVIVTRAGDVLGTEQLRPGDDALVVAKRLLRKSKGSTGFDRRLDYGPMGWIV